MSATATVPTDKFQSRDELVTFIEEQAATAVEKAARVERRVPWPQPVRSARTRPVTRC